MSPSDIREFIDAYVECALWSCTDEEGRPLEDSFSEDDLHVDAYEAMRRDCVEFIWRNRRDLKASGLTPGRMGHDFWLTRNRHGAGFWDEGLSDLGERLTDAAHSYGDFYLYVADGLVCA